MFKVFETIQVIQASIKNSITYKLEINTVLTFISIKTNRPIDFAGHVF